MQKVDFEKLSKKEQDQFKEKLKAKLEENSKALLSQENDSIISNLQELEQNRRKIEFQEDFLKKLKFLSSAEWELYFLCLNIPEFTQYSEIGLTSVEEMIDIIHKKANKYSEKHILYNPVPNKEKEGKEGKKKWKPFEDLESFPIYMRISRTNLQKSIKKLIKADLIYTKKIQPFKKKKTWNSKVFVVRSEIINQYALKEESSEMYPFNSNLQPSTYTKGFISIWKKEHIERALKNYLYDKEEFFKFDKLEKEGYEELIKENKFQILLKINLRLFFLGFGSLNSMLSPFLPMEYNFFLHQMMGIYSEKDKNKWHQFFEFETFRGINNEKNN
jgi:hypothetical protein